MAAQDGFTNGVQMGLGMFNAMQTATYHQQMLQNAEENQQIRRDQLTLSKHQAAQ